MAQPDFLPMPPDEGPPLPRGLNIKWPGIGHSNNPMSYMDALDATYIWASGHQHQSVLAGAALAYIDALDLAKAEAKAMGRSPEEGERTQLLYVLSNLTSWRGPEARETKEALKKKIAELS